jgi:hypothetical protein
MILWWAAVKCRLQPILDKLCTVPTGTSKRGAEANGEPKTRSVSV